MMKGWRKDLFQNIIWNSPRFFVDIKNMMKSQPSCLKESFRCNKVFAAIYSFQVDTSFVSSIPQPDRYSILQCKEYTTKC